MARIYGSRKRILVTGGAGFLGSHLIDRLLGLSHEILCVDNLFTGTKRNLDQPLGVCHPRRAALGCVALRPHRRPYLRSQLLDEAGV